MRVWNVLICCILLIPVTACAQGAARFDDTFMDTTMRIDYFHIGDASSEIITIDQVYTYGTWAGSRSQPMLRLTTTTSFLPTKRFMPPIRSTADRTLRAGSGPWAMTIRGTVEGNSTR